MPSSSPGPSSGARLVHVRCSCRRPASSTHTPGVDTPLALVSTATPTSPTAASGCCGYVYYLQIPPTHGSELLPPLRLVLPSSGPPAPPPPFLASLVRAPFWLNPVLSYLEPEAWLRLEAACWQLYRAVREADAWRTLDLGAFRPPSGRRKRREVILRRAAMVQMRQAWAAIEAFALPGLKWTLNAGLGEAEVRRLEHELPPGCHLPADLRASFMLHNGQSFHADPGLCGGGRLLTLQEVTKELRRQQRQHPQQRWPTPPPPPPPPLASTSTAAASRRHEEDKAGFWPEEQAAGAAMANATSPIPSQLSSPQPQPPAQRPVRMVPLSEGARGRSVCVALPYRRGQEEEGEGAKGAARQQPQAPDWDEDEDEDGAVGGIYVATALSCRKLADSWALYLGSLR